MKPEKEILVFSRMHITNYGDPIIGDCCKYLIEKTAKEAGKEVRVTLADVYEEDTEVLKRCLQGKDAVVFPGGGLNSIKFNRRLLEIFELIEQQDGLEVFFNAVGIDRMNPKPKNATLLTRMFKKKQVLQVTTRGDYQQLLKYIKKPKRYEPKLVFDPAIWADEAYHIRKKPGAKKIGIGVIRPEIYEANGNEVSIEDVFAMYIHIIQELERRGFTWELFTNGMAKDASFGKEILARLGLPKWRYMKRNVKSGRGLVKRIAGYQGVIASRLHANILATSLRIPSVGLVWNDKMNLFAQAIGQQERYINGEKLQDAPYIVHQLEQALQDGYEEQAILKLKEVTVGTIKNIFL